VASDPPRYDSVGDLYRQYKTTATLPILERQLFLDLVGSVSGLRVLDLATGYGTYARLALDLGAAEVVGVDISPAMVRLACQAGPSDRISFRAADARRLPPLGAFDVVTAVWLFNYADSPAELEAMAVSVRTALRPEGRLIAITINPGFDLAGPDWVRYGLTVDAAVPSPRRDRLEISLLTPTTAIPLSTSRWAADVYTAAMTGAGLQAPVWQLPTVPEPEVTRREPGYWTAAISNPFVAGFSSCLTRTGLG
jgi:SAM-dependent methyltransferase